MLLFLLLQFTTPPDGDTTGYWQQRVRYEIVATLEEERRTLVGRGTMRYVNNSPDTLRALFFHQHLNAFRPGSRWSAVDERENRQRFQRLEDPHYAFERLTSAPRVSGVAVRAEYPFAPDSTVVRLSLPEPLLSGDSLEVAFEWEARPSTRPRRQGRRGRQYDFAHWYPRIAVYDRGGWQHNPLVPAGEFYGEFGDYDVTIILRNDQVVGATGIPVEGDPGWDRARVWGTAYPRPDAYGHPGPRRAPLPSLPEGHRAVRFVARDVHHFGWATSPEFRYEGGLYDGRIAIHVLYRPQSAGAWGNGQAAQRVARALSFLEAVFGRYVYPQVTNLNRLDGGGTEFPMLMMNFTASQGLILHELAHIYVHGILANNEWRDAWLDEGLASYLTLWGQNMTPYERATGLGPPPSPAPSGYRRLALRPEPWQAGEMNQIRHDLLGRAEPMATLSHEFSEFGIYQAMSYGRAEQMWGALRDVMGDSAFVAFLREFYARWQLRHVDELAVRSVASEVHGSSLDWFFDQWLHGTGLIDYALRSVRVSRDAGGWLTRARVVRRGELRHPMPVGVLIDTTWMIARADPDQDDQWVEIRSAERPGEARLDPYRVVWDWDRRNHEVYGFAGGAVPALDWPLLQQGSRDRDVRRLAPFGWYTEPGGMALGVRSRRSYQGWIDEREIGFTVAVREPDAPGGRGVASRLNGWLTLENPSFGIFRRPLIGWRLEAWNVDGLTLLGARRRWDLSRLYLAPGVRRTFDIAATGTGVQDALLADPLRWSDALVGDLSAEMRWDPVGIRALAARVRVLGGYAGGSGDPDPEPPEGGVSELLPSRDAGAFWRLEAEVGRRFPLSADDRLAASVRLFAGISDDAPPQRSIGASSLDPTDTFGQHLYRGSGAPLARDDVHFVPLGGGGVRAYGPTLRTDRILAANVEVTRALRVPPAASPWPSLWINLFGDLAMGRFSAGPVPPRGSRTLGDAGVGLALRGALYDRPVRLRLDVPIHVSHPEIAAGGGTDRVRARVAFAVSDLW